MKIVENVTINDENTNSGSVTMDGDTTEMWVYNTEEARLGWGHHVTYQVIEEACSKANCDACIL